MAAILFIVAPLSVAGTATTGIKYFRLILTAAIVGTGIFVYQAESFKSTSKAFNFFAFFFFAGALWSNLIGWAVFNKGMFLMSALAGVYMAYTTKSEEQLSAGIKLLALSGAIAGFLLFGAYLANPDDNTAGDRLAVGGMNANTIGAAAGPMFIFSFFLGFWQPGFKIRVVSFLSSILLAIVILGSGSRGATLMAIVGSLMATKPFLQKKASTVILCVAIPLGGLQIFALATGESLLSKIPGADRILEGGTKENTREGMWTWTYKQYKKSPVLGIGWLHFGTTSANCHNAFLQILTDSYGSRDYRLRDLPFILGSIPGEDENGQIRSLWKQSPRVGRPAFRAPCGLSYTRNGRSLCSSRHNSTSRSTRLLRGSRRSPSRHYEQEFRFPAH